jgi:hypothetical protein
VNETALVALLMSVGVRHSTAVRVERILDDHGGHGVSGDWLADLILRYTAKSCIQSEERAQQAEDALDLWFGPARRSMTPGGAGR